MTKKGEGGDDPYRAQGSGVPWEKANVPPQSFQEEASVADVLRRLRELGGEAAIKSAPLVSSSLPRVKKRWVPRTFSVAGKVGESHTASSTAYTIFKGVEFFAMDDSPHPGHGTIIRAVFNGNINFFPNGDVEIPTWMFYEWVAPEDRKAIENLAALVGTKHEMPEARIAKLQLRIISTTEKMSWPTWQAGIPFWFQIEFRETCRWEGVLWGWEIS